MAVATQAGLELHVGGSMQVQFRLRLAGHAESITVVAPPAGPAATRTAILVDADNNNSFYAQARGRYRAPYQFSDEVITEFRVSSNGYSAELGRAGRAVFNVVTNSGGNHWHGTSFFYLRDRDFDAESAYAGSKPYEQQRQFGGTLGGPLHKNRAFIYLGFDQHQLTVPQIMQFGNGASSVVPQPADYDRLDKDVVFAAAAQLNAMAGEYPTQMGGNAGFAKLYLNLIPAVAVLPAPHLALFGDEQCVLRPGEPDYDLRREQQR